MSLATVDAAGQPSVRIVLCKEFDRDGFVFFTNYESRKGRTWRKTRAPACSSSGRSSNARCASAGRSTGLPAPNPTPTLRERPLAARIGAWASPQSGSFPGARNLEQRLAQAEQCLSGQANPPRPGTLGRLPVAAAGSSNSGRVGRRACTTGCLFGGPHRLGAGTAGALNRGPGRQCPDLPETAVPPCDRRVIDRASVAVRANGLSYAHTARARRSANAYE